MPIRQWRIRPIQAGIGPFDHSGLGTDAFAARLFACHIMLRIAGFASGTQKIAASYPTQAILESLIWVGSLKGQPMYEYLLLLTASWLGYRGASAVTIVLVAMLLTLPRLAKDQIGKELSVATVMAAANALMFAALAYAVGLGVASLLGS
jgi:hypothetical protein